MEFAKSGTQEMQAAHKKNASFDRDWSMSNATTNNSSNILVQTATRSSTLKLTSGLIIVMLTGVHSAHMPKK